MKTGRAARETKKRQAIENALDEYARREAAGNIPDFTGTEIDILLELSKDGDGVDVEEMASNSLRYGYIKGYKAGQKATRARSPNS